MRISEGLYFQERRSVLANKVSKYSGPSSCKKKRGTGGELREEWMSPSCGWVVSSLVVPLSSPSDVEPFLSSFSPFWPLWEPFHCRDSLTRWFSCHSNMLSGEGVWNDCWYNYPYFIFLLSNANFFDVLRIRDSSLCFLFGFRSSLPYFFP